MSIALVFDKIRPDTTGIYFERACEKLGFECDHWWLRDAAMIPEGYSFYLRIDHGDYAQEDLPKTLRPRIFYAIDSHLKNSWKKIQRLAPRYDWVCCAQRKAAEALPNGVWVPLGCDPSLEAALQNYKGRMWDIASIGTDGGVPRKFILQALRERYSNHQIGQASHEQMMAIYKNAKIGFNYSIRGEVNMRVFEILGAGSMLVTNTIRGSDMNRLGLKENKHYVAYRDERELPSIMDYYINNEEERLGIARMGSQLVRERHTYIRRMEQILRLAKSRCGVQGLPIPVTEEVCEFS